MSNIRFLLGGKAAPAVCLLLLLDLYCAGFAALEHLGLVNA